MNTAGLRTRRSSTRVSTRPLTLILLVLVALLAHSLPKDAHAEGFQPSTTAGVAAQVTPCTEGEPANNGRFTAPVFPLNTLLALGFCQSADVDWYTINVQANRTYRIETVALAAGVNTVVDVWDNFQEHTIPLFGDDNAGPGNASIATFYPRASEVLRVRVYQPSGAVYATNRLYKLRISAYNACKRYETNNTPDVAKQFPLNSTQTHAFCTNQDEDWVKFTVPAAGLYRMQTFLPLNQPRYADTYIELYNANGDLLAVDAYGSSLTRSDSRIDANLVPGDYYLVAANYDECCGFFAGRQDAVYSLQIGLATRISPMPIH